jgi:ParB-like chromosome segregation protein Spo0J
MKIESLNINELSEAEYNPRQLTDKQFSEIEKSIKKFGFVEPLVVNKNPQRMNVVVGGHQRLKVAKSLGFEEVPVYKVNLSLKKEKELNIRLNANVGSWDWDKIANEWDYTDLENWGLNIPITDFSKELLDFDEEPKEELVKKGTSTFEVALLPENKERIISVINQVKIDHEIDSTEDALLILCGKYMESVNE